MKKIKAKGDKAKALREHLPSVQEQLSLLFEVVAELRERGAIALSEDLAERIDAVRSKAKRIKEA